VATRNLLTGHDDHALATLHGVVRRHLLADIANSESAHGPPDARPADYIQTYFLQSLTNLHLEFTQRRDRERRFSAGGDRRDREELALTDDLGPGHLRLPEEHLNFVGRHRSRKEKPLADVALVDLELGQLARLFDTFSERFEIQGFSELHQSMKKRVAFG
jgi:hypothetical protein